MGETLSQSGGGRVGHRYSPVYEPADFAESDPTGEWTEHEDGLREQMSMQHSSVQPYLFFGGRCEGGKGVGVYTSQSDGNSPSL